MEVCRAVKEVSGQWRGIYIVPQLSLGSPDTLRPRVENCSKPYFWLNKGSPSPLLIIYLRKTGHHRPVGCLQVNLPDVTFFKLS